MTQTYGTLSVIHGFPARCTVLRRGASSPGEGGMVVSRQLRSSVSRQTGQAGTLFWTLAMKDMSAADRDALVASFDQAKAGALPLLFTAPPPDDATPIPVRFMDKLTIEYDRSAQLFQATVEVEEVI